jgi:hypothetical protein
MTDVDTLSRLELVLDRLERLVPNVADDPGDPTLFATVPPTVVAGELITSAWGNNVVAELGAPRSTQLRAPSQSIASGAQVAFTWDTEIVDNGGWHATGSSQAICPMAGLYGVMLAVGFNSGTASAQCDVVLNLGGTLYSVVIPAGKASATLTTMVPMIVGTIVEGRLYNGTGAAAFFNATISIFYLRATG